MPQLDHLPVIVWEADILDLAPTQVQLRLFSDSSSSIWRHFGLLLLQIDCRQMPRKPAVIGPFVYLLLNS